MYWRYGGRGDEYNFRIRKKGPQLLEGTQTVAWSYEISLERLYGF